MARMMTLEERIDAFVEELKEVYPDGAEKEGICDAYVILGVQRNKNGDVKHFGNCYGNEVSIAAALVGLFNNERLVELLDIASGFVLEEKLGELEKEE